MKISVREAFASYSYKREYNLEFTETELGGLPAPVSDKVMADVTITADNGTVTCVIKVDAVFKTVCSRCVKDIDVKLSETFTRLVRKDDDGAFEDVMYADASQNIDIAEEIRTLIYFGFPAIPLCSEDCKGLCPVCGCDLNEKKCSCDVRTVDPRLAVLKNLIDK